MQRSTRETNLLLIIFASFNMIALGQVNFCRDKHFACPSYETYCHNPLVRVVCKLTCGVCQPDQCRIDNGGCSQMCLWTGTKVRCACFPGFRLAGDNLTCEDINECLERRNLCPPQNTIHCVNTVGSFSCQQSSCSSRPGVMNYYRRGECCKVPNGTCGRTAGMEGVRSRRADPVVRVYGGREAAYSAWPWQAQIVYQGYHHCGASLIGHRWLIGAAHCFENHSHRSMLVYLGHTRGAHVTFREVTRRVLRAIASIITPPASSGNAEDIALIELSSPVTYSDVISPICMPCGEEPQPGDKCWVTGFGKTESSQRSEVLREVDVPIVDRDACTRAYRGIFDINQNKMMCAGYSEGKKDACVGDSGGPLACQRVDSCQWFLSGVTSFGKGCAVPGFYGVYTNVVHYEPWLRENLRRRNATGVCDRFLRPCESLSNNDVDCYSKLDRCGAYPHYMETNCRLACCQLQNNEIESCYDDPGSEEMCRSMKSECTSSRVGVMLRAKCRRTCRVC